MTKKIVDWQEKRNNESWRDFKLRIMFEGAHLRQEPISEYLARQLDIPNYRFQMGMQQTGRHVVEARTRSATTTRKSCYHYRVNGSG